MCGFVMCSHPCFYSNGSTQEEEAETASAVVMEKNKVAEDSDALKVEQPSDKVELAQPVEAPAEPEAELQRSKKSHLLLSHFSSS